ncbi:MAG: hypothetical protein SOT41_01895 [Candidatus Faecisoma sp.]|jgi:hypothetical protein|nr:hypothetical protein [Acholeplasma sp.]MDY2892520.1 hypothetical protein [Candidatus Faecisoma sp.]
MQKINEILKKYNIKPHRYEKNGKVIIVSDEVNKYVIKKNQRNQEIFEYLRNRSFDYYPKILNDSNDSYEISEYIYDDYIPDEQKMLDLIKLVSLLHNKTTHYKEVDFADYKTIYETLSNNIEYLYSYYNDIITLIETKVYMSPSEYLLARNISKIFGSLNFSKQELEKWYKLVENKTKQRVVVLHNNLDLSHFRSNTKNYLLSWDKAKLGIPIFDLYILYKRHGLDFNFEEILKYYESSYKLQEDEKILFFILIALPDKIEFDGTLYEQTKKIGKFLDLSYKTESLISPYYTKNEPSN